MPRNISYQIEVLEACAWTIHPVPLSTQKSGLRKRGLSCGWLMIIQVIEQGDNAWTHFYMTNDRCNLFSCRASLWPSTPTTGSPNCEGKWQWPREAANYPITYIRSVLILARWRANRLWASLFPKRASSSKQSACQILFNLLSHFHFKKASRYLPKLLAFTHDKNAMRNHEKCWEWRLDRKRVAAATKFIFCAAILNKHVTLNSLSWVLVIFRPAIPVATSSCGDSTTTRQGLYSDESSR